MEPLTCSGQFLFEQASGFAGGTADTSIQQLCLSAGLCLLYFVVSQQLMFYFQRRLLKQINTQLKQDVFHALMKKGVAKFTEKNSAVYLSVLNNDVTNLENNYFAKIPEIIQQSFVFLGCLAVLFCYDSRVAGMVLMTVWIPVAVPFLFGKQISKAEGRVYRSLEQYTGKLKDFFGGFEVIQSFQIEKETEAIFGNYVKDVEESRYHARFCESSGEVLALSLTYGTLFVQILFCAWMAAKGNIPANAMLSILYLLSSINNPVQNAVQGVSFCEISRTKCGKSGEIIGKT